MPLKITCPKSPRHKKFTTTAHEMHDWVVDPSGEFVKDLGCIQIDKGPEKGNCFTCAVRGCGAEANVEEVND